jgi:serralysin
LDIWHTTETVSYMIVERGSHYLTDGTWIEAGSVPVDASWRKVHLEHKFASKPVVLT